MTSWKRRSRNSLLLAAALFCCGAIPASAAVDPNAPILDIPIPNVSFTQGLNDSGVLSLPYIGQYVGGLYTFLISIVGLVAAAMMMVGGFQYLTSGGDKTKVTEGKKRIFNALVGMVLVFGSYIVLYTINPALVAFSGLQLAVVLPEQSTEPKSDPQSQDAADATSTVAPSGPPGNCATPGFAITDVTKVDLKLNKAGLAEIKKKLTPARIAKYKAAGTRAGVPWEILAVTHDMEAGMNMGKSILNGHELCNTRDNPGLLKECPACADGTIDNDLYCGAMHIVKRNPGLSPSNLQTVKLAFCRFNGCGGKRESCPELHPYVAPGFDRAHMGYVKSGIDCLPVNCKTGCVADITKKGSTESYGKGCCALKIYKPGHEPSGYDPGGSKCQSQRPSCKTDSDSDTATYQYTPTDMTQANPCGAKQVQGRIGALTRYALILHLESTGEIPK